jgi:hypothetical protein
MEESPDNKSGFLFTTRRLLALGTALTFVRLK